MATSNDRILLRGTELQRLRSILKPALSPCLNEFPVSSLAKNDNSAFELMTGQKTVLPISKTDQQSYSKVSSHFMPSTLSAKSPVRHICNVEHGTTGWHVAHACTLFLEQKQGRNIPSDKNAVLEDHLLQC